MMVPEVHMPDNVRRRVPPCGGSAVVIGKDNSMFVELTDDLIVAIDSVESVERGGHKTSQYTTVKFKNGARQRAFYDEDRRIWDRLRKAMGV